MMTRVGALISLLILGGALAIFAWGCSFQAEINAKSAPAPVFDCHLPRVQSGVLVKRLSDNKVVRIDVCGAADSADDTFRYEAAR